ncbi:hypothetical protein HOB10_02590 [Candidatus Parcubacteria bacterium]|jgi:hypothetical protein|nr:hypothetical protein [Candidatus Parcubacteria bacterium]
MLNTAIVFFLGMAIGYFFGQQKIKEQIKLGQVSAPRPSVPVNNTPPPVPSAPIDKDRLKVIRK